MGSTSVKLIVILLFIFSGICGLIYEVAWSKYLSLFIGNTAYSIMIVLATFMGGLALGSYYWGKYADRSPNRLKLYGMLELAIGVYCLFYPLLIGICEKIFVAIATGLDASSDQVVLLMLKFLLSFTTLIIPTFFMGGTLPVLTKFITRTIREAGKGVATLYYINSLGAVIGAGLAGFLLIRLYSLDGAVAIAAVLNLLIGTIALIVARKVQGVSESETHPDEVHVSTDQPSTPSAVRLAIITAVMSGFIAMIYELTWTRLLANILGSSTYSFTLMLIAFISGITLGSWIVSLIIGRIKNLTVFLGLCQLGTAISMIATLPFYERLPYYLIKISTLMSNKPENFPYFLASEFLFCFLIMIIPTSLSGMSLPIASRLASNDLRFLGKSIGGIFSINTIGTVFGALLTGLVLMPQFGVKLTIELGVLLNIFLGLGIIFYDGSMPLKWRIGITVVVIFISIGYRVEYPSWENYISTSGVFRTLFREYVASYDELKNRRTVGRKILWYKEGVNANVAVAESESDEGTQKSLIINGKADASTISDLAPQILVGQIPLMLRPDTGEVLVVGMGSGITCGSALRHPLRSLDCVELCSEVVECDSFFSEENYHFMQDPRARVFIDDAITYLKITPQKYDFIINEPTNPWIVGVGNLFTREFFELTKKHLRQGGVLAQWFQMYDMDNDILKLIVRTLSKSFPYMSFWRVSDADMLILASEFPIKVDFNEMQNKMSRPALTEDFARINIHDLPALLSTQIISHMNPTSIFGDGEINTEKRPLLELRAPISMFTHAEMTMIDSIDQRFLPSGENLFASRYAAERDLTFENYFNIAAFRYLQNFGDDQMTYTALKKCLTFQPDNIDALIMISKLTTKYNLKEEGADALRHLLIAYRRDPQTISGFIAKQLELVKEQSAPVSPQKLNYFMSIAETFGACQYYGEAVSMYRDILELQQREKIPITGDFEEQVSILAAQNCILANDTDGASQFVDHLKMLNPNNQQIPILTRGILDKKKSDS
ncbi:MAG: fused MFS/spermidine synthase [Bacteroidota bacterium]